MTTKEDDRVNKRRISCYSRLAYAMEYEKQMLQKFGTFSIEAWQADQDTLSARRNYDLWQKK